MAKGVIKVKKSVDKYQIPKNESIPLTHPVFAGAPEFKPSLKLFTSGTGIKGYIGIGKGRSDQDLVSALRKAPDIFGLVGFDISKVPKITNELEGGSLHLGINNATIELGGAFTGKFSLGAVNENINTFEGNAKIQNIPKLGSAEMELKRSKEGDITGKVTLDTQIKNVTGNFIIIWEKGVISGEGKVGYQGEKLSGSVTLIIMEKSQAEQLEQEKKAPEGKVPASRPKAGKARRVNYVVFGEGDLTFTFTEWLAGSAHVIIDHKGFLTVIGEITPAKEIELFPQKDYNKKLFKVEARASYGIPVVGNIFIFANVGMDAFANIGPGKLYKMSVKGTYSTDPKKKQNFTIQGSLNISAAAGMRLRGEAGAGLEILAHDIKAGAGINGIAGIRGYAEATPVIGYREKAKEGEDKKGEFFIRGELEIAAQPFLGLSGDVFVEIDAPWWSPVPDKRWTWPLVNKEWPIGGSLGMNASVEYVFGSKEPPAVEIKPAEFSADKFLTDLYSDKAKAKSGGAEAKKGTWAEKNAKGAEPPKGGKKGGAQVGEAPKLPPAQSKVKPGGAKKDKKPVDPNARTAEGKSVKEYQEEASKKVEKPAGKEPKKGAGKEEGADEDTGKKTHDEELKKGLAALDAVTKRYAEEGASKEEVKGGVGSVRRKFKVFKSIKVVDGGKTWDYEYIADPGKKKGPKKEEPQHKQDVESLIGEQVVKGGKHIKDAPEGYTYVPKEAPKYIRHLSGKKGNKEYPDVYIDDNGYLQLGRKQREKLSLEEKRKKYGPASMRKHHLIPQEINDKPKHKIIKSKLEEMKIDIHRRIVYITNKLHEELHEGPGGGKWNSEMLDWFEKNPNFSKKELEMKINNMKKKYLIPKSSENFMRKYGRKERSPITVKKRRAGIE